MKYIITENQVDKFLSKYCDKLSSYSEFEWVDKVDVNKTTTQRGGWLTKYLKPLYEYTVYIKSGYTVKGSDKDKIINDISRIHSMLFPAKNSNPEAYYSVNFIS